MRLKSLFFRIFFFANFINAFSSVNFYGFALDLFKYIFCNVTGLWISFYFILSAV